MLHLSHQNWLKLYSTEAKLKNKARLLVFTALRSAGFKTHCATVDGSMWRTITNDSLFGPEDTRGEKIWDIKRYERRDYLFKIFQRTMWYVYADRALTGTCVSFLFRRLTAIMSEDTQWCGKPLIFFHPLRKLLYCIALQ